MRHRTGPIIPCSRGILRKKPLKENQPHIPREFLGRLKGSGTNLPDRKAYLTDAFLKLMNILEKVVT